MGTDSPSGPFESEQAQEAALPLPPLSERRPLGITILAILNYVNAGFALLLTIAALGCKAHVMATILKFSDPSWNSADPNSYVLGARLGLAAGWFIYSLVLYFFGSGLWRLRDWARIVMVVLFVLSLIVGMFPYILWPASVLIKGALFSTIGGRLISFILVWYLVGPHVKAAFGTVATGRKSLLAFGALALLWLAFAIPKSGPELRAIKWHAKYGNEVTVNGVTFPLYYWFVPDPESDKDVCYITDNPGPLRKAIMKDDENRIWIYGFKAKDEPSSVNEIVARKKKAGFKDIREFQSQSRAQTLSCVETGSYSYWVECIGDGPLYSVDFYGNEASRDRFMRMMAEAH
jgi:hypothetical protein